MLATLLRRVGLVPRLVLLLLALGAARPALASHILGGEMSYQYLDANGTTNEPFRYQITINSYFNGLYTPANPNGIAAPPASVVVNIFNRTTGALIKSVVASRPAALGAPVTPRVPSGCAISGPSQPFYLLRFSTAAITLPATPDGYYAVYTLAARNNTLTNVNNPNNNTTGNVPLTLYVSMAPPLIYNRAPVFSDTAVAIVCANDTTVLLNNAVDADGDRLIYSFGTPYGSLASSNTFPPLPNLVPYKAGYGYSGTTPFGTGAGNFALINANTGTAKYGATQEGLYAVAVDVGEYRTINGREVLIGTTRRDLQLVVASCPPTVAPALPPVTTTPRSYTIEAGQVLSVPITATQANGHPLTLTLNSVLLDGPGGFNTTFNGSAGTVVSGNPTGTATATGSGTVSGTLVYNSACGDARATPYDVALTVKDNGCAGKTVADVLRITVTKPSGPTAVSGNLVVCTLNSVNTYTASGGTAPSVRWRAVGGTFVGANTGSSVQVRWTTAGAGLLVAKGLSSYGCLTDSVVQNITVAPAPALTVTGSLTVCQGSSTTLTVAGGGPYTITGGAAPVTGAGPFVLSPTQTTTYTIAGTATSNGCTSSTQVTVTVVPLPAANVGPPTRTTCSDAPLTLGVAAVAGNTYSWSPATGLSSSTVANPTLTLTNATSAPITQTYTLTETTATGGCTATNSVVLTVNPAVVPPSIGALGICANTATQIPTTPIAGNTYSWSPTTGLSNPNIVNPLITLPNTTGTAYNVTYTLTTTNTQSCSVTSPLTVSVNPLPVVVTGPAVTLCSGGSAQLGGPTVAGYTYSWSPATGLSDPNVANPIVTLTNATGTPITTTYILTVLGGSGTTSNGCSNTATVLVTVNPVLVAVTGPPVTICSGSSAQLGGAPLAGTTYSWSPATGLSSNTVANPTVTLTNTTDSPITQTYTLNTVTTAGCTGVGTVTVTVNPGATAAAGPAQAVCDRQPITLGTAARPGYTYQWTPAANLSSATAAQPVLTGANTTSAPLVQKYVVQATTALGCSAKDSVLITINPRPVSDSIGGPRSVCPTITGVVYSIKNPHATAYQWTVAGGTIAAGQGTPSIAVNWGAASTGSVQATSTNASGCVSDGFTLPVIINQQLQTAKPTGPASVCQADGPYAYQTVLANGSSYSWQLFGTARGTLVNTLNATSIRFTQAGLAKLVVTETSNPSGGICRGVSDTLYITVKPSPSATIAIQGPARFCVNSGAQAYTLPGAAGSTYVFQFNGTAIANVNGTVTIPASTAVGTYTLTARETNAGGCAGSLFTKTFTVDPRPGTIVINGPRFVCPATRSLTYTVPNATATSTYQWAVTGGTLTAGQGTATITVDFGAVAATNATVSVTETSQFGCGGAPVAITVVPDNAEAPQLSLASVVPTDNTKVMLTFAVASPASTPNAVRVLRRDAGSTAAFVQVGTVAASATTFVDATANAAQTAYEYSLALTNGCGDAFTAPVSATTVLLQATTTPGTVAQKGGGVNLTWTAYQGFPVTGYRLYRQDDNTGGYNLVATLPAGTLSYSTTNTGQGFNQCFRIVAFSATSPARASNSNTACVDFANKTAFYNIITPNGDGLNDKLVIDNVQLYPGNTMTIFNRWGREVFATTNYNNDSNYWGPDPGVAPGVYYYLFKLADGSSTKGWVEVVK